MTTPQRFRRYARVLLAASAMILATMTADAAVRYVTQGGGAVTKNGESWTTAYDEAAFPAAILSAGAGDEIWVKAGVYRPSTTNDASKSFVLKNGVAVYGGFAGTETSSADRAPAVNLTVLTGDLASDDDGRVNGVTVSADQIQGTNSKCVVTTGSGCGPTTVLDGFTITAGDNDGKGGGMYIEGGAPTVANCAFSGNRVSSSGGGEGGGGVCTSSSNAVFTNCVFSGNSASSSGFDPDVGGGMYNVKDSTPTVTNCTFSGNYADDGGGMANNDKSNPTVTNCTFTGNTAVDYGGGMYNNANSDPIVTDCAFSGNTASSNGGGMYNNANSDPTVTNCIFSGNSTTYNGGGGMDNFVSSPVVTNCTFSGNSATGTSGGGMQNKEGSNPVVTNCAFSGNIAKYGGGMYNYNNSDSTVTGCAFSGNTADIFGGGMYNDDSDPTVTNCTFSGNSVAQYGGGMCNYSSSAPAVTNCTFSDNSASQGGGMYNYNNSGWTVTNCTFSGNTGTYGGGMYNLKSSPTVTNCTFSGNSAHYDGGGMYNCSSDLTVTNCIFWNVSGVEFFDVSSDPTVTYSVVRGGYAGTENIDADPNLGPLAYNGGSTKTHALLPGSPAIDAGMPLLPNVSMDQRGVARPQGVSFDIGAYEYWEMKILTVNTIGSGDVTRDPSGDIFGTTGKCWSYAKDAVVALTAVDGARDFFVTWSADATGATKMATVTMSCDHAVEAIFDDAWIVTVSAGPGGDIVASAPGTGSSGVSSPRDRGASGTTTVKVRDGADQTFTVTPDAGYSIDEVLVDNVIAILGAGSKYTFPNVSRDHAIEATFTANPTPTAIPTTAPTDAPAPTTAPTAVPTATPTPVPTPDPGIPLPTVTLTITLYAGGTIVAGPFDITDPATLSALLVSPTLLAQLLATDPGSILSGQYNMDLVRFFSLVADLDDGVLDFTILFEVKVDNVPAGYRAQVFVLTRTFDSNGNPTGYAIVPRNEGANVFRKGSGARGWTETWRVTIRDGGVTDGDVKQDGSVAPQIAAVVAVFPMATPTPTVTPTQGSTGSGGGCSIPASGGAALAALLLLAPVVLMRRR